MTARGRLVFPIYIYIYNVPHCESLVIGQINGSLSEPLELGSYRTVSLIITIIIIISSLKMKSTEMKMSEEI